MKKLELDEIFFLCYAKVAGEKMRRQNKDGKILSLVWQEVGVVVD